MTKVTIDFSKEVGKLKPMNAVNNGPIVKTDLQTWHNFDDYKRAEIPFARTHDASFCSRYGGEHCVDVPFIFPNFDADETSPESYDFQLTDEYLKSIIDAGTEPYFRLGSKIEHWSKKYNTLPPKDFAKWARICEHIIMHYTEGWANGYKWHINYWEIWNEADGAPDNAPPQNKLCWGGTQAEFFEFYKIVACHLKSRFPHLKIGGPACSNVEFGLMWGLVYVTRTWVSDFLKYMSANHVPIDFFSWHSYTNDVGVFLRAAKMVRSALDKYGYTNTESHLNEWNYIQTFRGEKYIQSIQAIIGMKGAAFTAATMCAMQQSSADMLMYYDARPCILNGMFDFYTLKPLKGYYPFITFAKLKKLGNCVATATYGRDIFAIATKNESEQALQIVYYSDDASAKPKDVEVVIKNGKSVSNATIYSESEFNRSFCPEVKNGNCKIRLEPNSFALIELK